jgi:lipoprotein-releasing system ATP-binding protein
MSSAAGDNGVLLEAREIVKSYPTPRGKLIVLDKASVVVGRGEMLAVMGASGSGKSTLLHVLGALDSIDSGAILFDGEDISSRSETSKAELRNSRIGFVFQFYHLFSDFNALDNVLMPARIGRGLRGKTGKPLRERAESLLEMVGLADRMLHRPFELSGGEQQRVALARALLNKPDIILADEPSGNLDPGTAVLMHELLKSLNREHGQTIVVVTHNPGLVDMCDRAMYLVAGKISRQPAD